jgi:hypothetical protein
MLGAKCASFTYTPVLRRKQRKQPISQFAYLGSVAPDMPYYGTSTAVKRIADLFHWKKTGSMVASMLGRAHTPKPNQLDDPVTYFGAFILGFMCHVAADIIVHPYVNCYAGQYARQLVSKSVGSFSIPVPGAGSVDMAMHMFIELQHDAYVGKMAYGADTLSNQEDNTTGASWKAFINSINRSSELRAMMANVCAAINDTHKVTVAEGDLVAAVDRMHTVLSWGYDGARVNIPNTFDAGFVDHPKVQDGQLAAGSSQRLDYLMGVAAYVTAKKFWPAAMEYLKKVDGCVETGAGLEAFKKEARRELLRVIRQYNLDTGYDWRVYSRDNIIHAAYEHSWARFL